MSLCKLMLVVALIAVPTLSLAQTPRRGASADALGPGDEIICRRFLRTGTLADYYRTCKTRGEWERERRNIRQGVNNINSCRLAGGGIACTPG